MPLGLEKLNRGARRCPKPVLRDELTQRSLRSEITRPKAFLSHDWASSRCLKVIALLIAFNATLLQLAS